MPADYSFRQTADPIADQLVVQLYQTQDKQRIAQLYRHLLSDIEEVDYQGLPFLVKAYFQQNQGLPRLDKLGSNSTGSTTLSFDGCRICLCPHP